MMFSLNYTPKWRNVVDLHHLPGGTHSLAPRPGTLDRLTFQMVLAFGAANL